jgi:adenylate kinase family enzyme
MTGNVQRVLIVGNSGSGKTFLAQRIAEEFRLLAVDLDAVFWERSDYSVKRDPTQVHELVLGSIRGDRWVLEGVYGDLAAIAVPRTTNLIWLDLPWQECLGALRARGKRPEATEQSHAALLSWAESYWTRRTPSSYQGHHSLYEAFAGPKLRLCSRQDANELIRTLNDKSKLTHFE